MTAPAVWVLVGALAIGCRLGLALVAGQGWSGSRPWLLATAAALLLGGAMVAGWPDRERGLRRRRLGGDRRRLALAALGLVLLGGIVAGGRAELLDRGPLAELAGVGGRAVVGGRIVLEPRRGAAGTWTVVRLDRVDEQRERARAFLPLPADPTTPPLGATVVMRATARPLGHEGFEAYLRSLGAGSAVAPIGPIEVVRPPGVLLRATDVVRARVRAAASAHLGADDAALLSGLVTGDTTGASQERSEAFRDAGLAHLVAVSGSNVALVLGAVLALSAAVRLGARGRAVAGLVAVTWFAVLTRGEPSVLRATSCAFLLLLARATGRGAATGHALGVAALLLLLVDPFLVGSLGFLLSIGATAGVLVVAPRVAARVPGPRPLALLVGAAIGAQVGVAPFLLADGLPLAAIPANLVAVPAAALASVIGTGVALVAQLSVPVAGAASLLAWPALVVVGTVAEVAAGGPRVDAATLLSPAALGLLIALLARRAAPRTALVVLVIAVVAVALPVVRGPAAVSQLTVTALDVGQGDAVLVEVPPGRGRPAGRLLVDGGPDPDAAVTALRRRRVSALDVVAVSHPHADHTDGLPAVLATLAVGALLVGPLPLQPDAPASIGATHDSAAARSVPVTAVSAGARFSLGGGEVVVLSPPAEGVADGDPNENSLVLRVEHPDGSALLTGDAEVIAQEQLLRDPTVLRADILKVPHHGGDTNADGFLAAVAPAVALVSVGTGNGYGHPAPESLRDLGAATVLRTDEGGDATVTPRARQPPTRQPVGGPAAAAPTTTPATLAPARPGRHRRRGTGRAAGTLRDHGLCPVPGRALRRPAGAAGAARRRPLPPAAPSRFRRRARRPRRPRPRPQGRGATRPPHGVALR